MNIEKLLADKFLYPLKMEEPSEYWSCYRNINKCKIYVETHKSYLSKDRPSNYYLHDTKANKFYSISCDRVGGIAGFIKLLQSKSTDFEPIEILKLAREIAKKRGKQESNTAYYSGQLIALETLAKRTNNLDIADEIAQL